VRVDLRQGVLIKSGKPKECKTKKFDNLFTKISIIKFTYYEILKISLIYKALTHESKV